LPQSSPKVVVLPDAGPENPFQYELVRYLRQQGMAVTIGKKYSLGSTFRAIQQQHPQVIYYDWVHSFILGKSWLWSWVKSLVFILEILYTRFFYGAKIIHTLHNLQNHGGLWLGLERVVYGFFLRNCTQIRVYSEETRKTAIRRFKLKPERIKVIQDLPYHLYYENKIGKSENRKRLNLNEKDFVYLFFGELKPYKGLDNLLKMYAEIAQPNDRLIIAGKSYDPAYFTTIKQMADAIPSVTLYHRFIEDNEVQVFFNAADVVVLPFVRIDHSGSVDLAMSFQKPVVTLQTPAMMKLLGHQSELLFGLPEELGLCLKNAKLIDGEVVGQQNFKIADSTNYRDILQLFQ
jgi:glycosyltransferase involved in cell wall biosynthesis